VRTYFFGEEAEFSVFSIVIDLVDLWDYMIGIDAIGNNRDHSVFMKKWLTLSIFVF